MKVNIQRMQAAQARTGKSLTQLGISRSTLQRIRRGDEIRPQTVHKLALALCVDVGELITPEVTA